MTARELFSLPMIECSQSRCQLAAGYCRMAYKDASAKKQCYIECNGKLSGHVCRRYINSGAQYWKHKK